MKKINLILILILAMCIIVLTSFFLIKKNNLSPEPVITKPTIKIDLSPAAYPTRLEILRKNCLIYPNPTNAIKYNLPITPREYCATCGDGVCDYIEKCLPSNLITNDCNGGLFCQKDCK